MVHLSELDLQRLPDSEIFQLAISEQRVVLTFDLDFGEIAAHCQGAWASVLLFRLADATSPNVARRLDMVLPMAMPALEAGAVVVVEASRFRTRNLPIGRED